MAGGISKAFCGTGKILHTMSTPLFKVLEKEESLFKIVNQFYEKIKK